VTAPIRLWDRKLDSYPSARARAGFLAVILATTIVLYYQAYVGGAVGPAILAQYQISFHFYLNVVVISNGIGALTSLLAARADRWGRANLVVWGLLCSSLVQFLLVPVASNAYEFAVFVSIVGFVEGMVLVATPALVRDFSPQVRRGAAMGLWTMGPVLGSLVVTEVASNTLDHLHAWQDQYMISGVTGLVMFVVAFFTLRELSPALRDQLMVSARERVLIEARARGIDLAKAIRQAWRQMLRLDVIIPSIGISVFLLIYYAAVGFFVIYFTSVFSFSQARSNGLGNWFWAADAVAVIIIGLISDRVGVRKPFILAGTVLGIVMTSIFATRATDPATTYTTFIVIVSLLSFARGTAYSPWMTAFSETLEQRNPALVATGLAVWGWILRGIAALSFLIVPLVVTAVSPIADYGPTLQNIEATYPHQVHTVQVVGRATLEKLQATPPDPAALATALSKIQTADHVSRGEALSQLLAVQKLNKEHPSALAYLRAHGQAVIDARQQSPGQWRTWWWVCVAGQVALLPTIFMLKGRWRRSTALRDAAEREALVTRAMAELGLTDDGAGSVPAPA
jgi:MFS family permease